MSLYFDGSVWAMRFSSGSRADRGSASRRTIVAILIAASELYAQRQLQLPRVADDRRDLAGRRVPNDEFGWPNCGWLKTLKASARNCTLNCSLIGKSLNSDMSKFTRPGPKRVLRPRLPKREIRAGVAKAVVSNQRCSVRSLEGSVASRTKFGTAAARAVGVGVLRADGERQAGLHGQDAVRAASRRRT